MRVVNKQNKQVVRYSGSQPTQSGIEQKESPQAPEPPSVRALGKLLWSERPPLGTLARGGELLGGRPLIPSEGIGGDLLALWLCESSAGASWGKGLPDTRLFSLGAGGGEGGAFGTSSGKRSSVFLTEGLAAGSGLK